MGVSFELILPICGVTFDGLHLAIENLLSYGSEAVLENRERFSASAAGSSINEAYNKVLADIDKSR